MNAPLLRAAGLALLGLALATSAAQAQDRTFHDDDVERMKAFTVANATGQLHTSYDCLETINRAMRSLYNEPQMRLSSTVDLTMGVLQGRGWAAPTEEFNFLDENGRLTRGVTEPKVLQHSVWDGLLDRVGDAKGYTLFGLSPLDGNHSVLLVVDTHGDTPTTYWVDQWSSKGGWKEYPSREALDGEIEKLTNSWWTSKLASSGVKFKSRCQVYPLIPKADDERTTPMVTQNRVPRIRLRSGPGTDFDQVESEDGELAWFNKNESYPVLQREGVWARVELPDGSSAWAHTDYTREWRQPTVTALAGASSALEALGE